MRHLLNASCTQVLSGHFTCTGIVPAPPRRSPPTLPSEARELAEDMQCPPEEVAWALSPPSWQKKRLGCSF